MLNITFKTHEGKIITDKRLQDACNAVANEWQELAYDIRKANLYADHVTDATKEERLQDMLKEVERIRKCEIHSFTIWQRVNTELTGQCIALLG